jgi:CRISPR/Cas system-associated protein Cas7 (RAMP superfamily)
MQQLTKSEEQVMEHLETRKRSKDLLDAFPELTKTTTLPLQ